MKIGRIIETLAYFEVLPFFKCFQKLFRFNQAKTETTKNMGKILVVGATGGVGKRVVKILLENN
ncbi:MAG: NADH:ubiquinone oxidoreductase, partial [Cyanobacteria bacterium J083]